MGSSTFRPSAIAFWWVLLALVTSAGTVTSCTPAAPKAKTPAQLKQEEARQNQWRLATTVGDYERIGNHDPAWDAAAKTALENYAVLDSEEAAEDLQRDGARRTRAVEDAVAQGCTDPLVKYYYIRWVYDSREHGSNEIAQAYVTAAAALSASSYHEIRKYFAVLRAAQALKVAEPKSKEMLALRRQAMTHLQAALNDRAMPVNEIIAACVDMLDTTSVNVQQFPAAYKSLETPLFKNFSDTAAPYLVKGYFHTTYAWKARGNGTADTISPEAQKLFAERLAIAAKTLEDGWKVDPTCSPIASQMLQVELGQGQGRPRMELWFQRALATNPRNLAACRHKLTYLLPQWYGSFPEMIAFGRECVTNRNWGAMIPSILVEVHQSIANYSGEHAKYWRRPEVWPDLQAAFEELLRRNPDMEDLHYRYAWFAVACGSATVAKREIDLLKEPINVRYFGGKEAFEALREDLKTAASQ